MRNAVIGASLVILLTGTPSLVPAADRLEELERALEAQRKTVELLQQEINVLKQQRAGQQKLEQEVEGLKQAQQENQQLKREVEQLKITAKPKFEAGFDKWQPYIGSTDGNFRLSPVGRIQVDFRAYEAGARNLPAAGSAIGTDLTNNFLVRRGRIGLQGTFYKYFDFFVEADFGQGAAVLTDGYLDVHYWPELRLRAGQFKVPFSYEELFSDNNIDFVERSVADNLVPSRDVGAMLHGSLFGGIVSYAGGIFNGSGQNTAETNDSKDLAARLVVAPFKQTDLGWLKNVQFGGDITWGDEDSGQSLRGRTDGQFVFFNRINTRGDRLRYSGEASYYTGPFTLYGEYIQSQEERKGLGPGGRNLPDLDGRGWYLTATYLLTGETKVPGQPVIPNRWTSPVGPNRGWGAWELAARFAQLDFRAKDITGNRVNALTMGVNWYLTPNVKWLFNFVQNWFSDERRTPFSWETPRGTEAWELLTRLQLWF
jgi:phosphate-selective porin OprO/OprP